MPCARSRLGQFVRAVRVETMVLGEDFFFFLNNDSVNHSHFNIKPLLILYINTHKIIDRLK